MSKNKRTIIILLVYLSIFWIGFKSGQIYNMSKKKIEKVLIPMPLLPTHKKFFMVDKSSKTPYFTEINENHMIMQFLNNEKLKPLLRLRKIEIYTSKGERIY